MRHDRFVVAYLVVMGALIVGVDVLFLRDLFWVRLGVNIGLVAVFAGAYTLWFRHRFR